MARQVGQILRQVGAPRNRHVHPEVVHHDEGDRLVVRPSMKSWTWLCWSVAPTAADRGGTPIHHLPATVHPLAQALGPELPIPFGEIAEPVGVRHEHVDRSLELRVRGPVQRGVERGRIPASSSVVGRAGWPAARRRADPSMSIPTSAAGSSPTGESTLNRPPDIGRHVEGRDALALRRALGAPRGRVGGEDQMPGRRARRGPSSSQARTTRYCAIVSAVPPDLLMTLTSTRRGSIRRSAAATEVGSTFSSTVSRGRTPGPRRPARSTPAGGARSTEPWCPRAEPPMPSTST